MPLSFLTAGESHGPGLTAIIDGIPAGLSLTKEDIQVELLRRKKGYGRGGRQKIENEYVEILSGVRHGKTLGSPISIHLPNQDFANWQKIMQVSPLNSGEDFDHKMVTTPRPGHADYVGSKKYGHQDLRNVLERASARETAIRVALGAICKKFLSEFNIHLGSRVVEIGTFSQDIPYDQSVKELNSLTDQTSLRTLKEDPSLIQLIDQMAMEGNTLGGVFEVMAEGLPLGLGSYSQWSRKLEGKIGQSFLSLNAIKGVEVGLGFKAAKMKGSEVHDEYHLNQGELIQKTERDGGVVAGMTTGTRLSVRAAMKPLSTLKKPLQSVDLQKKKETQAHYERSDVCAVPSAAVIGENLMALLLAEEILIKFGGDSIQELKSRL